MIESRIPDEPTPYYFLMVAASWDCQELPGSDPPHEYLSLDWLGGNLIMEVDYYTLVRSGDPSIELVNGEGKIIANAKSSVGRTVKPSNFMPSNYETHGQLTLDVRSLPKARYFLKVDAPLPTYFLYRNGKKP